MNNREKLNKVIIRGIIKEIFFIIEEYNFLNWKCLLSRIIIYEKIYRLLWNFIRMEIKIRRKVLEGGKN